MRHLIETALLTHGLSSLSNEYIKKQWPFKEANLAYLENGTVKTGTIEDYLKLREHPEQIARIDCTALESAKAQGLSGAFTASATMAVCRKLDIPVAVTAGMGGIGNVEGEELCPDLPALERIPVILISTGPKDMLDRTATFSWLREHGVSVKGINTSSCTGYVFTGTPLPLEPFDRSLPIAAPLLLINEIPVSDRITDREILTEAIQAGHQAAAEGKAYHPAANRRIDERTNGYSSRIQLASLIENARAAQKLP